MSRTSLSLLIAFWALSVQPAHADESVFWKASGAAVTATGDIRVSVHRIYFPSAVTIRIVAATKDGPDVYAIAGGDNPLLPNGKPICDHPKYLALESPDPHTLHLMVYDGAATPGAKTCAAFTYQR